MILCQLYLICSEIQKLELPTKSCKPTVITPTKGTRIDAIKKREIVRVREKSRKQEEERKEDHYLTAKPTEKHDV